MLLNEGSHFWVRFYVNMPLAFQVIQKALIYFVLKTKGRVPKLNRA